MEEIIKKSQELKLKMLGKIEAKLNHSLSCEEMHSLAQCLNCLEEDKTYYERTLSKLIESRKDIGYAPIFNNDTDGGVK